MDGKAALQDPQRPVMAKYLAGTRFLCPQWSQTRMTGKSGLPYRTHSECESFNSYSREGIVDLALLFDGNRIRRGSNCSFDGQRRRAKKEFVDMVMRAVERKIIHIKNLSHSDADHGIHNPMPRLSRDGSFVGPYLSAPDIRSNLRK